MQRDCTRLRFGDATDVGVGHFTWVNRFINAGMSDVELDPGCAQQFRASWRSRAQHDSLHPLIFTCDTIADP